MNEKKLKLTDKLLREIISRAINEIMIDEADYPENFNMETFKSLNSFKDREQYLNNTLRRIASGTGRIVYQIDPKTVIKLAKNNKGVAQNETESEIGSESYFSHIVANVLDSHPKYLWLESQLAQKLTPNKFKAIAGYSIDDLGKWLKNFELENKGRKPIFTQDKSIVDLISNSELANHIFELMQNYDLPAGDLARISSYGEINGEIVITDYGLNGSTYKDFYAEGDDK